jgi:predicted metal-dependent hydrolase
MAEANPLAVGLAAFEARDFHAAHEAWEEVWRQMEAGHDRDALQGLIQAAVALHHLAQGNPVGARSVGDRAIARLTAAPSPWCGLRLRALGHALRSALDTGEVPQSLTGLLGGGTPG